PLFPHRPFDNERHHSPAARAVCPVEPWSCPVLGEWGVKPHRGRGAFLPCRELPLRTETFSPDGSQGDHESRGAVTRPLCLALARGGATRVLPRARDHPRAVLEAAREETGAHPVLAPFLGFALDQQIRGPDGGRHVITTEVLLHSRRISGA